MDRELLTVEEVAELLGITPSAVRGRVFRGTLPAYKYEGSNRLLFKSDEITGGALVKVPTHRERFAAKMKARAQNV